MKDVGMWNPKSAYTDKNCTYVGLYGFTFGSYINLFFRILWHSYIFFRVYWKSFFIILVSIAFSEWWMICNVFFVDSKNTGVSDTSYEFIQL